MSSDQIAFAALRNINVPTKGNHKGDKTQLKFEGLVSKNGRSVDDNSTNLRETMVSLTQAPKGQTAKIGNAADANRMVEQDTLADKDVDGEKQMAPIAEHKIEINEVHSRWQLHTGVVHPNVDFSRNLAEHKLDVATELPRDLPSKIDVDSHKSFSKTGPLMAATADGNFPLPENTVVLQDEPAPGRIVPERMEKPQIGNGGQSVEELHAPNIRKVTRSETADRTGEPFEQWNMQKTAADVGASKSMTSGLNVQQSAPAELRGLSFPDKFSQRAEPVAERMPLAAPAPIKLDRQPDLGSTRDVRIYSDMNVNAPPSEKVPLNTKFETRGLSGNPAKTDEISGAPPNLTDVPKNQFTGPIQPGGVYRSTISSHATASLLAVIEANSNWSGQLKALATTTVVKQDRNGNTPQTLRIQLHPAELGAMDATLRISGDRLHLNLSVEQDSTLRSLLRDSQAIHNALRASGFHVDELTITGTFQQGDLGTNERGLANGNVTQEKTGDGERPARKQFQGERDANDDNSNEIAKDSDADGLYI